MRLIAEGTEDEDTDAELRLDAVSAYIELLDKTNIPDILVKIMCWVSVCVHLCGSHGNNSLKIDRLISCHVPVLTYVV